MEAAPWVDAKAGLVNRAIFADPAIARLEQERIFRRCWQFVGHIGQIRSPGDFTAAYLGEDPILVVMQEDGSPAAFLNVCRHRGMQICRAELGNAATFACPYHGWLYGRRGQLVAVPNRADYGTAFDESQWGALPVRTEVYKGLIFATWDQTAPSLADYLGGMTTYIDAFVDRMAGGAEVIGGIHKTRIRANWKIGADNFVGDAYHGNATHASAFRSRSKNPAKRPPALPRPNIFSLPGGHGGVFLSGSFSFHPPRSVIGRYETEVMIPAVTERLGRSAALLQNQLVATTFPNFSFINSMGIGRVWLPRGADSMELWSWVLVDAAAPEEAKRETLRTAILTFSTGGIFEADDTENWSSLQQTTGGIVGGRLDSNIGLGLGLPSTELPGLPGEIVEGFSEQSIRNYYARWQEMIDEPGPDVWAYARDPR